MGLFSGAAAHVGMLSLTVLKKQQENKNIAD